MTRAGEAGVEEQAWTDVITAATRAPSIHNTQPWRFTASPDRLELYLHPERALPGLDPPPRQQGISCGIALEVAALAPAPPGASVPGGPMPHPGGPDPPAGGAGARPPPPP